MRDGRIQDPGGRDAVPACAYCPDGGREPAAADRWPPERLAHLYLCLGLSTYEIAGHSGIDRQRVTRLLRRAGVPVRPRGAGRLRPVRRNDPPGLPQLISVELGDQHVRVRQRAACRHVPSPWIECSQAQQVPHAQGHPAAGGRVRGSQRRAQVIDRPLRGVRGGQAYRAAGRAAGPAAQGTRKPAGRARLCRGAAGQARGKAASLPGQQRPGVPLAGQGDEVVEMTAAQHQLAVGLVAVAGAENLSQTVIL